jgi:ribosome-associated protein
LPLISTRSRVQIGSGFDCTCSMTQRANCWSTACLVKMAGRKLTQEGVLVITAQRYRTQERNRQDALERLVALLRRAAVRPAPRRPTKPTASTRRRRLEAKSRRAGVKKLRTTPPSVE